MSIDREYLRELASGATPGPWIPHPSYVWTSELGGIIQNWSEDANAAADMELIAAARNALPALLDMLGQAEQRIRDLTQEVQDERAACLYLLEQVQARDARIQAVEDLHRSIGLTEHAGPRIQPDGTPIPDDTPVCGHCTDPDALGWVDYPCLTIEALDGT